jgi:ABC-2 type transporter
MMFVVTILSLSALPTALASHRDKGYLRRVSTTPVGAVRLLAAQIVINLALAAAAVVLVALVSHFAFSVALPQQLGGFVLAMVLTLAAMLSLGTLVAAGRPHAADRGGGRLAAVLPVDVLRRAVGAPGLHGGGAARGQPLLAAPRRRSRGAERDRRTLARHGPSAGARRLRGRAVRGRG